MRLAIVSDTHFGDQHCQLVRPDASGQLAIGPKYDALKAAVGERNNYLILLGDIFDFSVSHYEEAYRAASVFFQRAQNDKLADEMIIVPGNHDADLWHTVEHEVNIIKRIEEGEEPRPFKLSVPGFIDDRPGTEFTEFTLAGVTACEEEGKSRYGDLYLKGIAGPGEKITFNVAYPNIYMVTPDESVLITHGHYLEPYWSFLGEMVPHLVEDIPGLKEPLGMKAMVGANFPLSQLACSGVGQAGLLTPIVRDVQQQVKAKEYGQIEMYIDRLAKRADEMAEHPWYAPAEWVTDVMTKGGKSWLMKLVKSVENTRYKDKFLTEPEVQERFRRFYSASIQEISELNLRYRFSIPEPTKMIFGHTHCPTPWGDPKANELEPPEGSGLPTVTLYNGGGWLTRTVEGVDTFVGADVFLYETGKGFWSVSVR